MIMLYYFRQSVYIIKTADSPIQQNIFTKLEANNTATGTKKFQLKKSSVFKMFKLLTFFFSKFPRTR